MGKRVQKFNEQPISPTDALYCDTFCFIPQLNVLSSWYTSLW